MRRNEENVKQRIFCLFAAAGRKNEKLREKKICVYMPIWRFRPMERTISDEKETCFSADSGAFHPACHGCAAQKDGQTTIVTSFYPMYVLTLNVTDGVDGVTVQNMAEQNVGCLHDYQLQTRDMVALEGADALVINGGGMEQFMDKVISLRADLPVIDASEGIEMFPSDEEHDHDAHGHDDHDELYNAHVWLDPNRAMIQVQNIAAGWRKPTRSTRKSIKRMPKATSRG